MENDGGDDGVDNLILLFPKHKSQNICLLYTITFILPIRIKSFNMKGQKTEEKKYHL